MKLTGLAIAWIVIVAVVMICFSIWIFPTNLSVAILSFLSSAALIVIAVMLGKNTQRVF